MSKDTITLYWAPAFNIDEKFDWSYLYPSPQTLFNDLKKNSNNNSNSFFTCPAVSDKIKKTLVFYYPIDASYAYNFDNNQEIVFSTSPQSISIEKTKHQSVSSGPSFFMSLSYVLFADQPLDAYFTPPFFHQPQYTNFSTVVPGEFNIGKWMRPYNAEIQTWSKSGEMHFKKDEPFFYVELKTDKKIELKRFEMTGKLLSYVGANINTNNLFGSMNPLSERYRQFKHVGMREKILTEIKKNIIDENTIKI